MTHRQDESDLLAWIEGVDLPPDLVDRLTRAFAENPSVRQWALDARRDRDRLRALAQLEAAGAPEGLVAGAMEIAEREALIGQTSPEPTVRAPRRIRVTPVRLVAAASIVIISAAATLVSVLFNSRPIDAHHGRQAMRLTPAPFGENSVGSLAMKDAPDRLEGVVALDQAPQSVRDSRLSEASPAIGALALKTAAASAPVPAPSADHAEADRSIATADVPAQRVEAGLGSVAAKAPLSFRLIHPIENAPQHAISPSRGVTLAIEGRLLLLIRAADPKAVEEVLLSQKRSDEPLAPRWRSIADLPGGGGGGGLDAQGASPGSAAARVLLVDVRATPGALEKLIAASTESSVGAAGAWLQEIADSVPFRPRLEKDDLMWWTQPAGLWARRVAVPVLIERIAPAKPDAPKPAQAPPAKPGSPSGHD